MGRSADAGPRPMVGRSAELAAVIELIDNPPGVAVVDGEAGIGKTTLVHAIREAAATRGLPVLLGHCAPMDEPLFAEPIFEALRRVEEQLRRLPLGPLAAALQPYLPEFSAWLPPAMDVLDDPAARRAQLFRALVDVLHQLGPAVCVLEDLHWSDVTTRDFIAYLMSHMPPGLVLVLTMRGDALRLGRRASPATAVRRIKLEPLQRADMARLCTAILGDSVNSDVIDVLGAKASGLPFAVEEVLRFLVERRRLVLQDGLWQLTGPVDAAVPPRLVEVTQARVERLQKEVLRLLEAAAVLDTPFSAGLAAAVIAMSEHDADEHLAAAVDARLLDDVLGVYRFRHSLYRQAIYQSTRPATRRLLHRRALDSVEARDPSTPAARKAVHALHGGLHERWLEYAEQAADVAVSMTDNATAAQTLQQVLASASLAESDRPRIVVKLARSAITGLQTDAARRLLEELLERYALPPTERAEVNLLLGRLMRQLSQLSPWREYMRRVADDEHAPPLLRAPALFHLGWAMSITNGSTENRALLARVEAAIAECPPGPGRTGLVIDRGSLRVFFGDTEAVDEISRSHERTDDPATLREIARGYKNLASSTLAAGHDHRAAQVRAVGSALARTHASTLFVHHFEIEHLLARWHSGDWHDLDAAVRDFVSRLPEDHRIANPCIEVLGRLQLARGEIEAAGRTLRQVYEVVVATDWLDPLPISGVGWLRWLIAQGRSEEAEECWRLFLTAVDANDVWLWSGTIAPDVVAELLRQGRADEADSIAARLRAAAAPADFPASSAASLLCDGLVADATGCADDAQTLLLASEVAWREIGRPYPCAGAQEWRGHVLARRGDTSGIAVLRDAREAYVALGASWDVARVDSLLRRFGAHAGARRGRRGYAETLSPRELEVAQLAAEGRTNQQIAARLFLSHRTVEKHVVNAMHKLGVTTRTDLRDRLDASQAPG